MSSATLWRAGVATDPGLERTINEDRVLADDVRGLYMVIDGLGGHAAGELAAQTALDALDKQLTALSDDLEQQIRAAIVCANNEIYELAQTSDELKGMACVLTLIVVRDSEVTVGHVGDSRLYLVWKGTLKKLTPDHSPVGEQEDHGDLTESAAMQHPRRNEVYRDVGSQRHERDDADFIHTRSIRFRPDAALLLCTDGLTDALHSRDISSIIDGYENDADEIAERLVEAANRAGGKDNVTAIFLPGPDFVGSVDESAREAGASHATTRMMSGRRFWGTLRRDVVFMLIGLVLGAILCVAIEALLPHLFPPEN
jgi:serine/threonine protein phosphatase PrpC